MDYEEVIDENETIDFTGWTADTIEQYLVSIHHLTQVGNYDDLVSFFTIDGWGYYSPIYNEITSFNESQIHQIAVTSITPNEIRFQTTESFRVGAKTLDYNNSYTLVYLDKPVISEFNTELNVQEVPVKEDALTLFLQQYRKAYMIALIITISLPQKVILYLIALLIMK